MTHFRWIRHHPVVAALLLLGLLLASGGLWRRLHLPRGTTLSAPLTKGPILESVYGIGTVTATRSFQLKWGVTGTVRKLFVQEGDPVKQGAPIATLDTTVATAPFDGTVTWLPVKVGENIFPQSVVFSLVDLQDRYVVVTLEQRGALRVRQGQTVRLNFDSLRASTFSGVVQAIYSHDTNFLVRIGVTDLAPTILPGMTGDVAIAIAEHPDALLIPITAIANGSVRVAHGGGSTSVAVRTGIVDGTMAEIVSGDLHEGDRLLLPAPVRP